VSGGKTARAGANDADPIIAPAHFIAPEIELFCKAD
jgi:hypothetical protein